MSVTEISGEPADMSVTEFGEDLAVDALAPEPSSPPLLEVRRFTKHFGEVRANTDVDLIVHPGEVHALVGENGAGKSTLLKLIYGVYRPDSGELLVDGREAVVRSPSHARQFGIGMVFQDLRLVPALTVAENIALALPGRRLRLDKLAREITAASLKHGLAVDPTARVRHLSIGERQRVEILKVLMSGSRLVILDEPTSVLAPQEVESLFGVVRHLRSQGYGIVVVTHKLNEVRTIADRVTVLRAGTVVLTGVDPARYTDAELVEAMVGRAVAPLPAQRSPAQLDVGPALRFTTVSARGDNGLPALTDVTLHVQPGELVGIAGVAGSGQRELCEVALGIRPVSEGAVEIDGQPLPAHPSAALAAGVVGVPEDPITDAVVPGLSVLQHIVLGSPKVPRKGFGIDWAAVSRDRAALDERVGLRMAPEHRTVADLSGGNIQRVMLTRALGRDDSRVVVAAYPSRGLDIATTRRTQELLLERRAAGCGVLVVSEDLDELLEISDRIAVLHNGHLAGIVDAHGADRQQIGRLMLGGAE
jgi:simple sugar transport system ATP-binding protein